MKSDPKSQWQGAVKGAKKQEKANDERRLYERIIDMERRRSEVALTVRGLYELNCMPALSGLYIR